MPHVGCFMRKFSTTTATLSLFLLVFFMEDNKMKIEFSAVCEQHSNASHLGRQELLLFMAFFRFFKESILELT